MKRDVVFKNLIAIGIPVLLFGFMFKIMHWPGAGILIISGVSIVGIWLLGSLFLSNEKHDRDILNEEILDYEEESDNSKPFNLTKILSRIAALFIIIGSMFKIMHWSGAGLLLIIGLITALIWGLLDLFGKK